MTDIISLDKLRESQSRELELESDDDLEDETKFPENNDLEYPDLAAPGELQEVGSDLPKEFFNIEEDKKQKEKKEIELNLNIEEESESEEITYPDSQELEYPEVQIKKKIKANQAKDKIQIKHFHQGESSEVGRKSQRDDRYLFLLLIFLIAGLVYIFVIKDKKLDFGNLFPNANAQVVESELLKKKQ